MKPRIGILRLLVFVVIAALSFVISTDVIAVDVDGPEASVRSIAPAMTVAAVQAMDLSPPALLQQNHFLCNCLANHSNENAIYKHGDSNVPGANSGGSTILKYPCDGVIPDMSGLPNTASSNHVLE